MSTMAPVIPPADALAFLNLQTLPGWTKDASSGIGPNPPAIFNIVQVLPPPVQPPMTVDIVTDGVKTEYCDWMAKPPFQKVPSTMLNCMIRASWTFDNVAGIQAWEIGRRRTMNLNNKAITDNGQNELVPQNGKLIHQLVPSFRGGWANSGAEFPMWEAGVLNTWENYYVNDATTGALSQKYTMFNGVLVPMPEDMQNIAGSEQSPAWEEGSQLGVQPDANTQAIPYTAKNLIVNVWWW